MKIEISRHVISIVKLDHNQTSILKVKGKILETIAIHVDSTTRL